MIPHSLQLRWISKILSTSINVIYLTLHIIFDQNKVTKISYQNKGFKSLRYHVCG